MNVWLYQKADELLDEKLNAYNDFGKAAAEEEVTWPVLMMRKCREISSQ